MTTTHTPGPWKAYESGSVSTPDGELLAPGKNHQTCVANAALIAAAPELLAALEAMREAYGIFYAGNCYIRNEYAEKLAKVNAIADAAIAAAKGGA